ncbi:MAG TPA: AAA family ATPase [Pyrinomonadaceae bacterium]
MTRAARLATLARVFNVCVSCGGTHDAPEVDETGAFLVCPLCGDRRPYQRRPLMLVGGPAGAGKSATGAALVGHVGEAVILESDLLWRREFNTPADGYLDYMTLWLRLCAHIAQSGRPVALFGAGFAVPHNTQTLPARRLFSAIHYLALVCADDVLAARLRARPRWRDTREEMIAEHVQFNHWLKANAATTTPPVTLIDTTKTPPAETAAAVATWIRRHADTGANR